MRHWLPCEGWVVLEGVEGWSLSGTPPTQSSCPQLHKFQNRLFNKFNHKQTHKKSNIFLLDLWKSHNYTQNYKQTKKEKWKELPCPCQQSRTSLLPPLGQLVQADSKKIFTFFKFYQNLKSRLMQCKDFNLYQKQVPQKLWMNFTFLFFVTSLFARYPLKIVSQVGLDRHFMFYPFLITGSSGPVWYWAGWTIYIFSSSSPSLLPPSPSLPPPSHPLPPPHSGEEASSIVRLNSSSRSSECTAVSTNPMWTTHYWTLLLLLTNKQENKKKEKQSKTIQNKQTQTLYWETCFILHPSCQIRFLKWANYHRWCSITLSRTPIWLPSWQTWEKYEANLQWYEIWWIFWPVRICNHLVCRNCATFQWIQSRVALDNHKPHDAGFSRKMFFSKRS